MTLLDIVQQRGMQLRPIKGGEEYYGGCPGCGSSGERSDRFRLWPRGGKDGRGAYWCRQCGKKGDAVQFLIDFDGISFKDAAERVGLQLDPKDRPASAPEKPAWQPQPGRTPAELWQEKAAAFAGAAHENLINNPEQLAYLAGRGIDAGLVRRFQLGWNPEILFRPRSAWGLPEELKENGRPRMLGLQPGIVIPLYIGSAPVRLRIRTGKPDMPYYMVPGSSPRPMLIPPVLQALRTAWVVVEAELDAMLLAGIAADLPGVGIIAAGNTTVRPTAEQAQTLNEAMDILIAMDADGQPGGHAWLWWHKQFPKAERWPVHQAKDPGDAYRAGADLRAWLLSGLSPRFKIIMEDACLSSLIEKNRGAGGPVAQPALDVATVDERTQQLFEINTVLHRFNARLDKRRGGIYIRCRDIEGDRALSALIYADGKHAVWDYIDNHPADVLTAENFLI